MYQLPNDYCLLAPIHLEKIIFISTRVVHPFWVSRICRGALWAPLCCTIRDIGPLVIKFVTKQGDVVQSLFTRALTRTGKHRKMTVHLEKSWNFMILNKNSWKMGRPDFLLTVQGTGTTQLPLISRNRLEKLVNLLLKWHYSFKVASFNLKNLLTILEKSWNFVSQKSGNPQFTDGSPFF